MERAHTPVGERDWIRPVDERWKLRNKSVAHITHRGGGFAAGMIEGSNAIHCWRDGKTAAGPGYDLIGLMEKSERSAVRKSPLPQTSRPMR